MCRQEEFFLETKQKRYLSARRCQFMRITLNTLTTKDKEIKKLYFALYNTMEF